MTDDPHAGQERSPEELLAEEREGQRRREDYLAESERRPCGFIHGEPLEDEQGARWTFCADCDERHAPDYDCTGQSGHQESEDSMHEHTHVEINREDPGRRHYRLHYIGRINGLIADLQREREHAADASAARNLSLAITHLEDALLRVAPPLGVYQPNPGVKR